MSDETESGQFDMGEAQREVEEGKVAIYPDLDREGGTIYREGGPDTEGAEVAYEDWAAQEGVPVEEDDDTVVEGDEE